jgi:hypothetical protein
MPYSKQHDPWVQNTTVIEAADMDGIENGIAAAQSTADGKIDKLPHQFRVEDSGAVGDGQIVADIVTTSGSATITSATANWTSADVGKHIMINGAVDAAAGPLITTIATFNSATSVTLAANATRTYNGLQAVWGTDDTANINAAITAAKDYALAHNYFAEVLFASKIYVIAAPPTQQTSPAYYNTQLLIPYAALDNHRKLEIGFVGAAPGDHLMFWGSTFPNIMGTTLVSMSTGPSTQDTTYYRQSVLGGPSSNAGFAGGGGSGSFVNVKASVSNLQIVCPAYTNVTAFDFTWLGGVAWNRCGAHIFATPLVGPEPLMNTMVAQPAFKSTIGVGVVAPTQGNNADNYFDSVSVEGYATGMIFSDHCTIAKLGTIYNNIAGMFDGVAGLSGVSHGLFIGNWCCEVYNGGLWINGGYIGIDVFMSSECSGVTYDLRDDGNSARGVFRWQDAADNRTVTVSGGALLDIHDIKAATFWRAGVVYNRPVVLTDAATIATDASKGNLFTVTLGASRTMGAPTNPVDGQQLTYVITQGGAGSFTVTWDAAFSFGTVTPTLQTAAGSSDSFSFVYLASASKWVHVK